MATSRGPMVNNLVKAKKNIDIDNVFKLHIITGALFGVERPAALHGLLNKNVLYFIRIIALILNASTVIVTLMNPSPKSGFIVVLVCVLIQQTVFVITPLMQRRKWEYLIDTLNDFDRLYGLNTVELKKWKYFAKRLGLLLIFYSICSMKMLMWAFYFNMNMEDFKLWPCDFTLISEWLFYTHLLQHLYLALNAVSSSLEKMLRDKNEKVPTVDGNVLNTPNISYCARIIQIQSSYKIIVKASDLIQSVIKWQFASAISLSLAPTIIGWHEVVLTIIDRDESWWMICLTGACVELAFLALYVMCCSMYDRINFKVNEIKTKLAEQLCSVDLDKKDREAARAFLAFVEQHDLKFRLLRVVDVGVALPMQFITLVLTYLIILLQFGKLVQNNL